MPKLYIREFWQYIWRVWQLTLDLGDKYPTFWKKCWWPLFHFLFKYKGLKSKVTFMFRTRWDSSHIVLKSQTLTFLSNTNSVTYIQFKGQIRVGECRRTNENGTGKLNHMRLWSAWGDRTSNMPARGRVTSPEKPNWSGLQDRVASLTTPGSTGRGLVVRVQLQYLETQRYATRWLFSFGGGRVSWWNQGVLLEAVEPPNTEFCVCTAYVCVLSEGGVLGG